MTCQCLEASGTSCNWQEYLNEAGNSNVPINTMSFISRKERVVSKYKSPKLKLAGGKKEEKKKKGGIGRPAYAHLM